MCIRDSKCSLQTNDPVLLFLLKLILRATRRIVFSPHITLVPDVPTKIIKTYTGKLIIYNTSELISVPVAKLLKILTCRSNTQADSHNLYMMC